MFMRQSTLAVAAVIALSAAAATTQVFAADDDGVAPTAFVNDMVASVWPTGPVCTVALVEKAR